MTQLKQGDAAPDADVADHVGRLGQLSDYWAEHPVFLLFVRHFG